MEANAIETFSIVQNSPGVLAFISALVQFGQYLDNLAWHLFRRFLSGLSKRNAFENHWEHLIACENEAIQRECQGHRIAMKMGIYKFPQHEFPALWTIARAPLPSAELAKRKSWHWTPAPERPKSSAYPPLRAENETRHPAERGAAPRRAHHLNRAQ